MSLLSQKSLQCKRTEVQLKLQGVIHLKDEQLLEFQMLVCLVVWTGEWLLSYRLLTYLEFIDQTLETRISI